MLIKRHAELVSASLSFTHYAHSKKWVDSRNDDVFTKLRGVFGWRLCRHPKTLIYQMSLVIANEVKQSYLFLS